MKAMTPPKEKETGSAWPRMAEKRPTDDILAYVKDYARENPEAAALWCFGIGFVLGWKLKPW